MDFESHSPEICTDGKSSKIAQTSPSTFFKNDKVDNDSTMQARIEWIDPGYYGRLGGGDFSQYSGLTPESFSNHQNDSCLTPPF